MGRRICQFGIEHGRCRCVCPDKAIPCDVPEKHGGAEALKKWGKPEFSAEGLADGERIDQLTAALDAAQDEIEKLIAEHQSVRHLHQRIEWECGDDRCDRWFCEYCLNLSGDHREAPWPCDTIKALGGAS